jgi:hypothetical protein
LGGGDWDDYCLRLVQAKTRDQIKKKKNLKAKLSGSVAQVYSKYKALSSNPSTAKRMNELIK